ncbi:MAG TPA: tetratricopeptide repeat protein [bacterium]|nr:tetratricopeptide repeat protein [bacterium]
MHRFPAVLFSLVILALAAGCGRMPDEKLMELGRQMEESERFADAIQYYEKLVKKYPESPLAPEALHNEGKVYANGIRDYDRAVETFDRVIATYPNSPYAAHSQFMIGFVWANSALDTARARVAYEKFMEKYPDHELIPSVDFELRYLGKDINEIPELMSLDKS